MEKRVLAKKDDLVAIADAIRLKTGDLSEMTLAQMPTLISEAGEGVSPVYQTIAEGLALNKTLITDEHLKLFKDSASLANYAFSYCTSITSAEFLNVINVPTYAFSSCSNLTTANFPNAKTLSAQAFYFCKKLNNINFPLLQTIYSQALSYCDALETVSFPLLTKLNGYTFYADRALTKVFLNANVAGSMGSKEFQSCTSLTALVIRSEQAWTLSNVDSFTSTPIASGTGYIYVPSALVETYKTATNWSTYATQFRALENYTVDGTITGALDETKISAANE